MNIKTKLRLGTGFLFILIITLVASSTWYINRLSTDAKLILKDNYLSIDISKSILQKLGANDKILTAAEIFEINNLIKRQQNNITEAGEDKVSKTIAGNFAKISADSVNLQQIKENLRTDLYIIIDINMKAIILKNNIALQTSKNATIYVSLFGSICIIIALIFIVNFPGYIANPIKVITEGIKEIAQKNYQKRIYIDGSDEFAQLAAAFNQMAKRLNDFENSNLANIIFQKLRLETIINNMRDAVIGLDENKNILFANPVALNLLNAKAEDLKGSYALDFALKNDLMREILAEKNQKELKIYADERESFFSKEIFELKTAINPENDELSERHFGSVILLKNITKYHELDLAKTNFMATISHELKTPIAAIKMSLKLLNDDRVGEMNKEQTDLVKNIEEDTQRLLKLTSEMLDLTQLETGNIQLNIQEVEASEILEYAMQAIKFSAAQKQIEFNLFKEDHLPALLADVEKTAWVVINFISNAIRYSPEKAPITINIKKQHNFVSFTISDLGKGIDEKYQKRIFERYFQVPSDTAHKGGTGLGLAISKEFIEAQNGSIFVESEIGTGSTFGFLLPAKQG
ncbi:MAG: ATP-binding protein [Pelobium sp.]